MCIRDRDKDGNWSYKFKDLPTKKTDNIGHITGEKEADDLVFTRQMAALYLSLIHI